MNKIIKKSLSFILALIVFVSAFSLLAYASDYDYGSETLSFKTEFYKQNSLGEWVKTTKVDPGDEVKARLFVGTTYYTSSIQMIAFYNEAFFAESYTENSVVSGSLNTSSTSSAVTERVILSVNRIADTHRILAGSKSWDGLVPEGYITQEYVDTHNAFVISGSFDDGGVHRLNDSEWLVEFDFKVNDGADGSGYFEVLESTFQSPERQSSYSNIPVSENGAEGDSVTTTPLYAAPIVINIDNGTVTTIEEETTTETTTEPEITLPQITEPTTTKPETTAPQVTEPTTTEAETTAPHTTIPATTKPETTVPQTTKPTTTEAETTAPHTTIPATTKPGTTVPQTTKPTTTKPETTVPQTTTPPITQPEDNEPSTSPDFSEFRIKEPSKTKINCADGIVLHVETDPSISGNYSIVWSADNGNFTMTESNNGESCTIVSSSKGDTVITATVVDEEGNEVASDSVKMNSNAGFFQKILAFFKKLFKLTKIYEF